MYFLGNVMENEVKKLLYAMIIIPLRYFEWVDNLVPVRKQMVKSDFVVISGI
jgi:hypothetical protein